MEICTGHGRTKYGTGIAINLTSSEVATAIDAYLVAQGVVVRGTRTIRINNQLIKVGRIYVDPSGSVISEGVRISGRDGKPEE